MILGAQHDDRAQRLVEVQLPPGEHDTSAVGTESVHNRAGVFQPQARFATVQVELSYFACRWDHDSHEEPVLIYEELDAQRFETRKVEEFRDGHRIRSDTAAPDASTGLSTEPIPSIEEIANQAEFTVLPLSESEFEEVWATAQDAQ